MKKLFLWWGPNHRKFCLLVRRSKSISKPSCKNLIELWNLNNRSSILNNNCLLSKKNWLSKKNKGHTMRKLFRIPALSMKNIGSLKEKRNCRRCCSKVTEKNKIYRLEWLPYSPKSMSCKDPKRPLTPPKPLKSYTPTSHNSNANS